MACRGVRKGRWLWPSAPSTSPPAAHVCACRPGSWSSALPESDTRLHHIPGEKPAWLAIGLGSESDLESGLAQGLAGRRSFPAATEKFWWAWEKRRPPRRPVGTAETDAANPLEPELDYRFSDSAASCLARRPGDLRAGQIPSSRRVSACCRSSSGPHAIRYGSANGRNPVESGSRPGRHATKAARGAEGPPTPRRLRNLSAHAPTPRAVGGRNLSERLGKGPHPGGNPGRPARGASPIPPPPT